ncbi:Clp protease N-terminal domain-containing protein [Nonomuraea sp. SYSU D8015]|uniref:Clp protease N-terminal domain-containing protein n=1 Tax=Nonomuraea sp. SYSU D8015 TaxID=2593644 RepID=UPI001660A0FF|nr:Clp protease N-terminal domain-containing protein [Nonomuraea sp. SYSU D8015]
MRKSAVLRRPAGRVLTRRAAHVIRLAQEEAEACRRPHACAEHLLLGLLRLDDGVGVRTLRDLGTDLRAVRDDAERHAGDAHASVSAEEILRLARQEAFRFGHRYVGTEHLVLAIIREGRSAAARILTGQGIDLDEARRRTISVLRA